ncbi:efflux RND transporter periplasmic adaptor subunit [Acidihalobacter ferrooxydans]|uniref:Uncharacterized protein n=1 Tax=Acidihalobacter ferrooxydans TaxID=1765967 RepID=A0A1P8UJA9_9GAMM|nr:efflux RND transporter periplasmic adaptor subunit [Acidihalobacter ferrooxydans]APZ43913.1 hypothetical protein BW247_13115 [Acidihalobacter ferrooxydans]
MQKRIFGWLTVAGMAVALAGCGHSSTDTAKTQGATAQINAQVVTLNTQSLPIYATFPGSVSSSDQVQIASRLTGYVRKVYVHEGQQVKQGALLLRIDPNEAFNAIQQAKAAVAKAQAALSEAKANYDRYQALYQQNAVPEQQFQQFELAYKVAKGNLASAQSALRTANSQWSYSDVRAPFAGVVVSKMIDAGQLATPGQPLLTLQSSGHMQVQVQVDSQAFGHLHLGQSIPVTFDGADFKPHTVQGIVERMVSAADPMTHTHTVKIGLPENSGATSGDYARVRVSLGDQSGILVPESAVRRRAGIEGVFVVGKKGLAAFHMVRLGEKMGDKVVVLAGLVAGDRVVTSAQGDLFNGVKIKGDGA